MEGQSRPNPEQEEANSMLHEEFESAREIGLKGGSVKPGEFSPESENDSAVFEDPAQ